VYCSGQVALDPASGSLIPGGVKEQTEQALKNLGEVLGEALLGFNSVVKTTVFMTDLSRFAEMNEVYARSFVDYPPARSTVQVAALPKGALVEIEAVAYAGR
jgi:2-iminobutanoate/2-iminopropanoate deaminase